MTQKTTSRCLECASSSVTPPRHQTVPRVVVWSLRRDGNRRHRLYRWDAELVAEALDLPTAIWGNVKVGRRSRSPTRRHVRESSCPLRVGGRLLAARNYSFGLGTARWLGYVDSDDRFDLAKRLRPTLQRTEKEHPESNCITLPYDYADGELMQDKFRFVRWQDGWKWTDEIHEYLVREPVGHGYCRSTTTSWWFTPARPAHARSLERNIRICTAVRDRAAAAGNNRKVGLMSYYLGQYSAAVPGCEKDAIKYLEAAVSGLGTTTWGATPGCLWRVPTCCWVRRTRRCVGEPSRGTHP